MSARQTMNGVERDYLRTVFELAEGKAKSAVSYGEVCDELGRSDAEAEQACAFWADCGVLEWPAFGHVALTYMGQRRAERLFPDSPWELA